MKQEKVNRAEIKLVGLTTRTNNQNEMDPNTAKIKKLAERFWGDAVAQQINARKTPGTTFSVYTEYDSDEHGDYTYFIGEEVDTFTAIPAHLQKLVIPAATYQKFTTPHGKFPEVVINAWQNIWRMPSTTMGGQRVYHADFEVYDERAQDPQQACVDIYIGIK